MVGGREIPGSRPVILGELNDAAITVLVELLRDPDEVVRWAAAKAFTENQVASRQAVPVLIERWQTDQSAPVRTWARQAVLRLDPEAALKVGMAKAEAQP
jgi:HEAT repeat protein